MLSGLEAKLYHLEFLLRLASALVCEDFTLGCSSHGRIYPLLDVLVSSRSVSRNLNSHPLWVKALRTGLMTTGLKDTSEGLCETCSRDNRSFIWSWGSFIFPELTIDVVT